MASLLPKYRHWLRQAKLPVALYLLSIVFILATNTLLTGSLKFSYGHASHSLVTSIVLAGFLYTFRKDRRDLLATGSLYLLLIAPAAMIYGFADPEVRRSFVTCQKRDRKQLLGNFSKCVANVLHGIFMLFPESNCTTTDSIGIRSTVDCSHSIASILHRLLVIARYPSVPRHHHCALANQSC